MTQKKTSNTGPVCVDCGVPLVAGQQHGESCDACARKVIVAKPAPSARERTLRTIAASKLGLTLETQGIDSLDFHNVAVWNIRAALEAAYTAGIAAGAIAALNGLK